MVKQLLQCPLDETDKSYREDCKSCDFYHPYTTCTFKIDAKLCPFDKRKCNSSAGKSSVYDCRHDYGFEVRPPRCEVNG